MAVTAAGFFSVKMQPWTAPLSFLPPPSSPSHHPPPPPPPSHPLRSHAPFEFVVARAPTRRDSSGTGLFLLLLLLLSIRHFFYLFLFVELTNVTESHHFLCTKKSSFFVHKNHSDNYRTTTAVVTHFFLGCSNSTWIEQQHQKSSELIDHKPIDVSNYYPTA